MNCWEKVQHLMLLMVIALGLVVAWGPYPCGCLVPLQLACFGAWIYAGRRAMQMEFGIIFGHAFDPDEG